jgi:uncharacterized phage-associated protein
MKLINKELEKRINAILYFCETVKYPYKLKIFKLLYFLDFIHFKQVGRPVTDLEYFAFAKGPVPIKFYKEIEENSLPEELAKCIEIFPEKDEMTGKEKFTRFVPKLKYNLKVFTKREQEILKNLALIFKEAKSEDMSEVSHLENEPWNKTIKEKGLNKKIDFFLALDNEALIDKETAEERYNDIKMMKNLFS